MYKLTCHMNSQTKSKLHFNTEAAREHREEGKGSLEPDRGGRRVAGREKRRWMMYSRAPSRCRRHNLTPLPPSTAST